MRGVWLAAAAAAAAQGAAAGPLESVQVGALAHNTGALNADNAPNEGGANIEAQLNFQAPDAFSLIGRPRPFLVASVNTDGAVSYGGLGLQWRAPLLAGFRLEPELGYVIHDGEVENPFPNGDPRATQFSDDHILYGSRDLFRTALGLTRDVGDRATASLFFNHLSHGQILGSGRNQGVDELGVRVGWRLGE